MKYSINSLDSEARDLCLSIVSNCSPLMINQQIRLLLIIDTRYHICEKKEEKNSTDPDCRIANFINSCF